MSPQPMPTNRNARQKMSPEQMRQILMALTKQGGGKGMPQRAGAMQGRPGMSKGMPPQGTGMNRAGGMAGRPMGQNRRQPSMFPQGKQPQNPKQAIMNMLAKARTPGTQPKPNMVPFRRRVKPPVKGKK